MTLLQTLDYFKPRNSKINLYFLQASDNLKSILGSNDHKPELKSFEFVTAEDLEAKLLQNNIDPENILGLVYKNLDTETNQLELFFLTQLEDDVDAIDGQNIWLTVDDIQNNYTEDISQIAALYAFGYLNCIRDKDEVSWYPVA